MASKGLLAKPTHVRFIDAVAPPIHVASTIDDVICFFAGLRHPLCASFGYDRQPDARV
jgi:hypothetical protein